MRTGDTIAAIASAPGPAPLAIVRLSGPDVTRVLKTFCAHVPRARGIHDVRLRVSEDRSLEMPARCLLMPGPRSYTGEDCCEFQVPGSVVVAERTLACCVQLDGVRPAEAGEFTARAYLHGKLSLDEAEGVQSVISARGEDELRAARAAITGETGARVRTLVDRLAHALALVEAGIDFTDQEDVVAIEPDDLRARLTSIRDELASLVGTNRERATGMPRVALVGPPNAGKSTLFNALLGRERVAVSDEPGTTRDAIVESIDLEGVRAELVDLAGLDETLAERGGIDADAQGRARDVIESCDLVLHCDPSGHHKPPIFDGPVIRVRTKADLVSAASHKGAIGVCALDGFGVRSLIDAIRDVLVRLDRGTRGEAGVLVIARHRTVMRDAIESLDDALRAHGPELRASAMRSALDALGSITGDVTPDDVIGRIFASFCIGK
ncbi:MAG: tRNA modification GTPase [Planctomycetota bacterium]